MSETLRIALGLTVLLGSIVLAAELSKSVEETRHRKYVQCVARGEKPILCSFIARFK